MKNIVEKPCDYTFRVLKFISNCINIHVDSEICSLLIAIFRLIFWIWKLREREIFMRKIGSKQCGLCIVAIIVLCLCVVLVACDADDVKNLFQPSDFTITFVLNNGEDNVVWRRGDEVPMPTLTVTNFCIGVPIKIVKILQASILKKSICPTVFICTQNGRNCLILPI